MNQNLKKEQEQKAELQKEKAELVRQQEETEKYGQQLEEELKQLEQEKTEAETAGGETEEEEEPEQEEPEETKEKMVPGKMEGLQDIISSAVSGRISAGENWGVYVCRLSDGAEEHLGEGKMVAASLIKLYIMGAVYSDYDDITAANGKDKIDSLLHSMITVSDNDASNTLIQMLGNGDKEAGKSAINAYCNANGYADSSIGRMLLETNTDRENYTSVKDCTAFLKKVYKGEIAHASDMLSLLKQQERTGKIPAGVPSGVVTANKTGELSNVENDAAIILSETNPYILCVMSENLKAPAEARQTIINLSSNIYNQVNK